MLEISRIRGTLCAAKLTKQIPILRGGVKIYFDMNSKRLVDEYGDPIQNIHLTDMQLDMSANSYPTIRISALIEDDFMHCPYTNPLKQNVI